MFGVATGSGELKKIWHLIYGTVRRIQTNNEFDKALEKERSLTYQGKSDNFFFQRMCDLVFQSGIRGVIWQRYEGEIRKQFCDYDVRKVAKFNDKDVERMLSNPKMFKNRKKIEACVYNAKVMVKLSEKHSGFTNFISEHKVPELIQELTKRFKFMGAINAYAFLRYVGLDVIKPDINIRRVFYRLGLIKTAESTPEALKEIQEVGEAMAKAVGVRVTVVDYTIYMYGSGEFLRYAICGVVPKCDECQLKKFCQYYKVRGP